MSIISQTTWDKFTQEEKESIQKMYNHYKEYKFNKSDEEQEGAVSAYDTLFGKENLQPQPLTYEDVARGLFKGKDVAFIDSDGDIDGFRCTLPGSASKPNVCISLKQAEKLLAINKLLNVAAYLNKNEDGTPWKPEFKDYTPVFTISIEVETQNIEVIEVSSYDYRTELVYFRTEELAKQAIQILGEDTVRMALSSDY